MIFSQHQFFYHQLGVLQFNSLLTLPGDSVVKSHKTAPTSVTICKSQMSPRYLASLSSQLQMTEFPCPSPITFNNMLEKFTQESAIQLTCETV